MFNITNNLITLTFLKLGLGLLKIPHAKPKSQLSWQLWVFQCEQAKI